MKTRKVKVILLSLALIMVMAISGTLAFITASSNDVNNTFEPGRVTCKVDETFNGTTKTNVTITNTGNVRAYIRAEIVVTWQNENGDVYGKPVAQNEYELSVGSNWKYNEADGFYYYPSIVEPNVSTRNLIDSCKLKDSVTPPAEGYYLCVEVLASAIQADGVNSDNKKAVEDAWEVTISDGVVTPFVTTED